MPKQILEFKIEISGNNDSKLESRKLELLQLLAKAISGVQLHTDQYDAAGNRVTLKTSFASNLDLFKELPNNLKDIKEKTKINFQDSK